MDMDMGMDMMVGIVVGKMAAAAVVVLDGRVILIEV